MFSLHLLSVIGLISLWVPLSSQVNLDALKHSKYDSIDVEVETTTTWDNQLNISQITTDNDPKTQVILFYNVEQYVTIQDSDKTLNISKYRTVNAFDNNDEIFTNEVTSSWNHTGGSSNVTLRVNEKLEPKLDFSHPRRRSVLHYGVVIQTEINSVFDEQADFERVYSEFPALKAGAPGGDGSPIALSNYTGIDTTTCLDTLCSSTTVKETDVKRYVPYGNVVVYGTRYLETTVGANKTLDGNGNTLYSRVSTVNLDYYILIGFNNP